MNTAFDNLPEVMRWEERPDSLIIAKALTGWQDEVMQGLNVEAQDFYWNCVNPYSCRAEWLDWSARLSGYDGEFWSPDWDEGVKRSLIADFRMLWDFRGTPEVFQYLLDAFELDAKIKPQDGWILGGVIDNPSPEPDETVVGTAFSIRFGGSPFQWQIELPPRYGEGSTELLLIQKLRGLWLSNAIDIEYVYRATN